MNFCRRCQKRRGKRKCPLFEGWICPPCCGEIREKEGRCPPTCPFFKKHEDYQEVKYLKKNVEELAKLDKLEKAIAQSPRLSWLAWSVEKEISQQATTQLDLDDHQIIKALTQTLEILERGGKKIILTDQPFSKTDPLTEKIQQTLDTCQYKRDIIVPDDYQSYTLQEKKQVIEMLLARANFLARRLNFKGKEYLKYIITQLENIDKKLSPELFLD